MSADMPATPIDSSHHAPRFSQRRQGRIRRRRHRQRPGRADGGERAGAGRAERAAAWSSITSSAAWPRGSSGRAGTSSTSRCTAFPYGMVKSCRRYWTQEIADSIVQLKHIRFDNPMFSLTTSFNRDDFTRLLTNDFKVDPQARQRVLRHGPRDEFLRRPVDDDPRAVRALLPRPRGRDSPADGADHLRQRQHARRPGDQLRHRVLELHVEGRVHVRRRHRQAHRADGGGAAQERRRCLHQVRRDADRLPRRPRAGRRGERPDDPHAGRGVERQSQGDDFQSRRRGAFRPRVCRRGPGRAAQQFQHAGLHGAQAGRADRRIDGRPAVQLDRAAVPHRAAA